MIDTEWERQSMEHGKQAMPQEADFTEEERVAAVNTITTEWPYYDPLELYEADGDSAENIAVCLQMRLARRAAPPVSPPDLRPLVRELRGALCAALEWIDAVPDYAIERAMPGFDRDCAEVLLSRAEREIGDGDGKL